MKLFKLLTLGCFSICLCSCGNSDMAKRRIFLSGKFNLQYAAINNRYSLNSEPAYFKKIPNCTNCLDKFDKSNSYVIYNVKMVDGKPIGFGSLNLSFANKTFADRSCEYFEYVCEYDKVYGGEIKQTSSYKIDFIGKQYCRGHYWWTRMECWLPEISDDRIILEFSISEYYDEPEDFNYKINL